VKAGIMEGWNTGMMKENGKQNIEKATTKTRNGDGTKEEGGVR
jgi:hypothetical protein